jgi:hypothetical protein
MSAFVTDTKEQPYINNQVVPRTDYVYVEDRIIRRTLRVWLSEKHSVSLRSQRRLAIMTEIFRGFSQSVFLKFWVVSLHELTPSVFQPHLSNSFVACPPNIQLYIDLNQ